MIAKVFNTYSFTSTNTSASPQSVPTSPSQVVASVDTPNVDQQQEDITVTKNKGNISTPFTLEERVEEAKAKFALLVLSVSFK